MSIERVGIVGSGAGGSDLAELAAIAGLDVVVLHVEGENPLAIWESVTQAMAWQVARGSLGDAGRETALARIHLACEPDMLSATDLVFECATYLAPEARRALLADVEQHMDPNAILSARVTGFPSDALSPKLLRPCRFVGLNLLHRAATHFIEVAPTERTRASVIDAVEAMIVRLGRAPLRISDPGEFAALESSTDRPSVF